MDKAYKCADEVQYRRGYEDAKKEIEKQGKNNMGISESTKQKLEDNLNKALEKETPESWNKFLDEQKPTDNEMIEILRAEYEKGRADAIAEMQNPTWSEEDRKMLYNIIHRLEQLDHYWNRSTDEKMIDWLKSIKGRVQPQPQPLWSEEDDGVLNDIIFNLRHPGVNYYKKPIEDKVSWLNALKGRCCSSSYWKASKKQLETLEFVCDNHIFSNDSHRREMESLLKQLKAL